MVAGMFLGINTYSQDIVSVIKDFYKNADMNCYINKAQKRMMEEYKLLAQWDSIYGVHYPPPEIDLHQSIIVPVLNVQFLNMENYNYSDDIYDYIAIDSVWVFSFVCVDKKIKEYAAVNFPAPSGSYYEINNLPKAFRKKSNLIMIKNLINRHKPELILRCAKLAGGIGGKKACDDGYMYIKGDKIYKFVMYDGKSYELNEFFRKGPRTDSIYDYLNLDNIRLYLCKSYIPLIYRKDERDSRRTGNAPENEKMICP